MTTRAYDRTLKQVRAICLALPEATEVEAWGHARQEELLADDRFFPTPYAARQGWVSLRLGADTDWDEVGRLAREAYRQVALRRMLKVLDEGAGE